MIFFIFSMIMQSDKLDILSNLCPQNPLSVRHRLGNGITVFKHPSNLHHFDFLSPDMKTYSELRAHSRTHSWDLMFAFENPERSFSFAITGRILGFFEVSFYAYLLCPCNLINREFTISEIFPCMRNRVQAFIERLRMAHAVFACVEMNDCRTCMKGCFLISTFSFSRD